MKLYIGGHNPSGEVFESNGSCSLRQKLEHTFKLVRDASQLEHGDIFLAIDASPKEYDRISKLQKKGVRSVLIAFEPEAALPWQTKGRVESVFDYIIWVGRGKLRESVFWPQNLSLSHPTSKQSPTPVLIAANKLSFAGDSLYYLRRKVVRSLPDLRVYGEGWDRPFWNRLTAYVRALMFHIFIARRWPRRLEIDYLWTRAKSSYVEEKIATMSAHRIAIVIENSREVSTEKLWDALRAGCVPIYVGPVDALPECMLDYAKLVHPSVRLIKLELNRCQRLNERISRKRLVELMADPDVTVTSQDHVFDQIVRKVSTFANQKTSNDK